MASEKINALIEEVKGLTVLELSELVHALEEVSSALPCQKFSPGWQIRNRPLSDILPTPQTYI